MNTKRILHGPRRRSKRMKPGNRALRLRTWLVKYGVVVRRDGMRLFG